LYLLNKIKNKKEKISVVGLGYVGLPLAVAFAEKADVIAFDINSKKVEKYKKGIDVTKEAGDQAVKESTAFFTADESKLKRS
jgi:UDP-N-acetyl-D-galactosamine dehydrogenase